MLTKRILIVLFCLSACGKRCDLIPIQKDDSPYPRQYPQAEEQMEYTPCPPINTQKLQKARFILSTSSKSNKK